VRWEVWGFELEELKRSFPAFVAVWACEVEVEPVGGGFEPEVCAVVKVCSGEVFGLAGGVDGLCN